MGGNSLLIVPAGFDASTGFNSSSSLGLTHTAGSTLVVPAGQGFGGMGAINDPVNCQGTITAVGGTINLNNGLALSGTGTVVLGSGTLTVNDAISGISGGSLQASVQCVGRGGSGLFTQSAGANSLSYLYLGYTSGSSGTYSLSGGSLRALNEYAAYSGAGSFTQSGGTNTIFSSLYLGYNAVGSGTYSLSGGSLRTSNEYAGYSGMGSFTQSGGTNTLSGTLSLGYTANSSGIYSLSGGSLSAPYEYVGYSGMGTFTQSGGTNHILSGLSLGYNNGTNATYNLNGGTLILPGLGSGWGIVAFNFGGGTLQAATSLSSTMPMTLSASGGNATIDTAGFTVTLSGEISGPGGLTKTDSGTLALAGTNMYTGDTLVSRGTLQVINALALQGSTFDTSGSGSLNFSNLTAATLGGLKGAGNLKLNNTALALTVGANNANTTYSGTLSGGGSLTKTGAGTLLLAGSNTYNGGTTVNGGLLQFNVDSDVPGSGHITINSGGALALDSTGTYSTVNGWLSSGKIVPASAGALALIADDSETISMSGYASLSLGASGSVTFNGTLTPSGTTYNLGGGGGTLTFAPTITGATSLNVNGPGAVVLTGSNTYSGLTTISAGTLQLGGGGTTGSISSTSNVTDNSVLAFDRSDNISFTPVISGSGGLVQLGPAALTLSGSNTYSGGTTISAGSLQFGDGVSNNGPITSERHRRQRDADLRRFPRADLQRRDQRQRQRHSNEPRPAAAQWLEHLHRTDADQRRHPAGDPCDHPRPVVNSRALRDGWFARGDCRRGKGPRFERKWLQWNHVRRRGRVCGRRVRPGDQNDG